MLIPAKYTPAELKERIGATIPIPYHKILSKNEELRVLLRWCIIARKYHSPEIAQIIIDSYVLNLKTLLRCVRENGKRYKKYNRNR